MQRFESKWYPEQLRAASFPPNARTPVKTRLLLVPLLALAAPAAAQHTELIGRVGASFSQYRGSGTEATSFVNYRSYAGSERGYTNNPYGSRLGTGFALGGRVQRVGRRRGLLAFDLGYDWARSRTVSLPSITRLATPIRSMPPPVARTCVPRT